MADMKQTNKSRQKDQAQQARRMQDKPEPIHKGELVASILVGLFCAGIIGGWLALIYALFMLETSNA